MQRTFDIWSFALNFFWRLWLVNQKFTYGKEGMTPPRVSQRRAELVGEKCFALPAWLKGCDHSGVECFAPSLLGTLGVQLVRGLLGCSVVTLGTCGLTFGR